MVRITSAAGDEKGEENMLSKKEIEELLDSIDTDLKPYNYIYKSGYKQALRNVLEIKNPKAKPATLKI